MAALWRRVSAQAHIRTCHQAELWCRASVLAQLREREQADHMFDVASMLLSAKVRGTPGTEAEPTGNARRSLHSEFKARGDCG